MVFKQFSRCFIKDNIDGAVLYRAVLAKGVESGWHGGRWLSVRFWMRSRLVSGLFLLVLFFTFFGLIMS